jgi:uncharacterized pyridoxamine 5'-phosphate oxidase family protein
MSRDELLGFLRAQQWAVEATVDSEGRPQGAVIGVCVTEMFELLFDTRSDSRKAANLRGNPRIALVMGWDDGQTAQIEGIADEPLGEALRPLQEAYLQRFPDGRERAALGGIAYFRVVPDWIRYSDFRCTPPAVALFMAEDLHAPAGSPPAA